MCAALEHEREQRRADIDSMFDGASKHAYTLHAVLVHDGRDVKSGHYWAFLYERAASRWLKFNDTQVSVVDEAVVWKESVGGAQQSSSAYCLVYVSDRLAAPPVPELPALLRDYVRRDNDDFQRELRVWRDSDSMSAAVAAASVSPSSGASAIAQQPPDAIGQSTEEFRQRVHQRLDAAINDTTSDPDEARLRSLTHYLLSVPGCEDLVQCQIATEVLTQMFPQMRSFSDARHTAFYERLLRDYHHEPPPWELSLPGVTSLEHHRQDFAWLRGVVELYVAGMEGALMDQWVEALAHAVYALQRLQASVTVYSYKITERSKRLQADVTELARLALLQVSAQLVQGVRDGQYPLLTEAAKLADVAVEAMRGDAVLALLRKDWDQVDELLQGRYSDSRDPAINLLVSERITRTYRTFYSIGARRLAEPVLKPSADPLYLRYRRCKKESAGKWPMQRNRIADAASTRDYIS